MGAMAGYGVAGMVCRYGMVWYTGMLWQGMVLQCKSRMGGAFGASGTRVPPLSILPKVSGGNGREWEEGGGQAEEAQK